MGRITWHRRYSTDHDDRSNHHDVQQTRRLESVSLKPRPVKRLPTGHAEHEQLIGPFVLRSEAETRRGGGSNPISAKEADLNPGRLTMHSFKAGSVSRFGPKQHACYNANSQSKDSHGTLASIASNTARPLQSVSPTSEAAKRPAIIEPRL